MKSDLFKQQRPAWTSVIMIFLSVMLGFIVIGPLIGFMLVFSFFDGNLIALQNKLALPSSYPEIKIPMFVIQASATLIGLILVPALYIIVFEKKSILNLFKNKLLFPGSLLLAGLVTIVFMVPNSFFIEWNAHLSMPDCLREFEVWAKEKEKIGLTITTFLTTFNAPSEFLFAFFTIAILPGIGEELFFRGMLQPELQRATGNAHAAIWISAIMFSAIHLQFFGFIPRMFLGVLFGYLYYWSGHIIIPMFAHFVNNGIQLVSLYLYQTDTISFNLDSDESAPLFVVVFFTFITFVILFYFKKLHKEHKIFLL